MERPTCSIQGCEREAMVVMSWPEESEKAPLSLCPEDEQHYRAIAGGHMTFSLIQAA